MAAIHDPRLDRLYEEDWRSLDYTIGSKLLAFAPMYRPRSYTWSISQWLDQGSEGSCVGHAFAHDLTARPQEVEGIDHEYARQLYFEAQQIDPWAGGAYAGADPFYEGTSTLAGAKVCQNKGYYDGYYWGVTVEEVAQGIAYWGPCILGINWYEGMYWPDSNGFLHPVGNPAGGHALLAHSVKIVYKSGWRSWMWWARTWSDVDLQRSYVWLHNSWGRGWGVDGRAKLSLADLALLLSQNGDACFPNRTELRDRV